DESGKCIGSVSGGCLEADVLERAKTVFREGEPAVVVYDSTRDENSVFGLQMGCRGIVRILLEPVGRDLLLSFVRSCFDNREPGAIATLILKSNGLRLPIATRLFWQSGLKFDNESPDSLLSNLLPVLSKEIELSLRENRSRSVVHETPLGETEFF